MRLVGRSEAVATVDLPLRGNLITIGSAAGNDIVVDDRDIGRRRAFMRRRGSYWLLESLDFGSGTRINGIRVLGTQALRPGDFIEFGPATFFLQPDPGEMEEEPKRRAGNRKTWLGASLGMLAALSVLVGVIIARPEIFSNFDFAGTAMAVLPTSVPTPASPTATSTLVAPTLTVTATPRKMITLILAVSPTSTSKPVPTATPTLHATPVSLESLLAGLPQAQAEALSVALGGMSPERQQVVIEALAAGGPEEVSRFLGALLGETVLPPLSGRLVLGRYSEENDRYDLVIVDVASGVEELLLPAASQPSFSPDGSLLAYHSWQPDALGLYAASADVSQRWLLTRDAHVEDSNPSWKPDGSTVAFSSLREGDNRSRIYVVSARGGVANSIAFGEFVDWSPDGTQVAIEGCIGGSCGIIVAAADGSDQRLLTREASDGAPTWSPDGQYIAFHSARGDNWDIYVMRNDGSDLRRLTTDETTQTMPTWSPDGTYIAFRSNQGVEWGVWAVPAMGGEQVRLFSDSIKAGDETYERLSWLP